MSPIKNSLEQNETCTALSGGILQCQVNTGAQVGQGDLKMAPIPLFLSCPLHAHPSVDRKEHAESSSYLSNHVRHERTPGHLLEGESTAPPSQHGTPQGSHHRRTVLQFQAMAVARRSTQCIVAPVSKGGHRSGQQVWMHGIHSVQRQTDRDMGTLCEACV